MKIINWKLLNKTASFYFVLYVVLLVAFSYSLIIKCINYSSVLEILSSLLWITVCIAQLIVNWRSLTTKKSELELNIKEINRVFSKEWKTEELSGIIAIFVLSIPFIAIVAILLMNPDFTNTQLISAPKFKLLPIWSNILFGLALIFQALEELFDIKKYLVKRILTLFNLVAINSAFIMYLIYVLNMTEKTL